MNLGKFINPKNDINHIALVLPNVEHSANKLKQFGFHVGQISFFEAEGTKEIYIESEKSASLLLMQPAKDGSYQKALNKRGPSLHHIAIDVINLEISIKQMTDIGWQLHANSQETIKDIRVAWFFKSGFPSLIEVSEVSAFATAAAFVKKIKLAIPLEHQKLLNGLSLQNYIELTSGETELLIDGKSFKISDLI